MRRLKLLLLVLVLLTTAPHHLRPTLPSSVQVLEASTPWDMPGSAAAALCELIDRSQHHAVGAFYELSLPSVAGALLRAQVRGVRVQLHLEQDNLRNPRELELVRLLEDAGCALSWDTRSTLMHCKLLVVDSRYVWCGATNPTWAGTHLHRNDHLLLDAPALAARCELALRRLREGRPLPPPLRTQLDDGNEVTAAFAPGRDRLQAALSALGAARSGVDVLAFSLTHPAIVQALVACSRRGLPVRVCVDARLARGAAARAALRALVDAGCDVRAAGLTPAPGVRQRFGLAQQQDVKLHYKLIVVDGNTAICGSANLSSNGMEHNDEMLVVLHGPAAKAYLPLIEKEHGSAYEIAWRTEEPWNQARTPIPPAK